MIIDKNTARLFLLVLFSAMGAMVLSLLPLPNWAVAWWPRWMVLVVIFWSLVLPERVGVGSAWLLGLWMDILQGTLIGEQALALSLVSFIVIQLHGGLQILGKFQRVLIVFGLVLGYQLFLLMLQKLFGKMPFSWFYLIPPFTSALCWPLVYVLLSRWQQHWRLVDPSLRNLYTRL